MMLCGRKTPSRCSCKRTFGRLANSCLSSFMRRGFRWARVTYKTSATLKKMIHLHVRDLLQNCGAPPCCTIPAQSRSAKNERSGADRGASGEDELWFASWDFISDGDAGAVCFYPGSHYPACSHHPPGLRTGRQWDMAGICIGDGSGVTS